MTDKVPTDGVWAVYYFDTGSHVTVMSVHTDELAARKRGCT